MITNIKNDILKTFLFSRLSIGEMDLNLTNHCKSSFIRLTLKNCI